jgi:hypothetical protein
MYGVSTCNLSKGSKTEPDYNVGGKKIPHKPMSSRGLSVQMIV